MKKNEEMNGNVSREWTPEEIEQYLKAAGEELEIPESLKPEQMEKWLREQEAKRKLSSVEKGEAGFAEGEPEEKAADEERKAAAAKGEPEEKAADKEQKEEMQKAKAALKQERQKKSGGNFRKYRRWFGAAATAACLALVVFAVGRHQNWSLVSETKNDMEKQENEQAADTDCTFEAERMENVERTAEIPKEEQTTYGEIYQSFDKIWKETEGNTRGIFNFFKGEKKYEMAEDEAVAESPADANVSSAAGNMQMEADSSEENPDHGTTNQQEADVEEADIIKNDGRYLYQVILSESDYTYGVQITDTKGGLKEAARLEGFDNIKDIYVWEDTLVILEPGWAQANVEESDDDISWLQGGLAGFLTRDDVAAADIAYTGSAFCRIHVYDITDRTNPEEIHTFTVKGNYQASRISDGYLYYFAQSSAYRPKDKEDYEAYIPMLDGKALSEDCIYLPEDTECTSYLVMASINMKQPDEFTDTKAIVTSADQFYVSKNNIYVTDSRYSDNTEEGESSNSTRIYRFSYQSGIMKKEAEGSVKGTLRDAMALNEYNGYLRMVTTVDSYSVEKVIDDITGKEIGYSSTNHETTNSLYVLDDNLKVVGKIEKLAKDELIYSARFMGDSGYFVTFRQIDPLFSVDLSDPENPKILGELKISGFSEYLHFYSQDLLLGIGLEADEETGRTEGMKLSMFDISDPTNVTEQSKMDLSEYSYADALYNYKAVLIDTEKNLFGFEAESYEDEYHCDYLLFSYEDGSFQQLMKIECTEDGRWSSRIRGTYIGDTIYILYENGKIEAYSLVDGSKTGELAGNEYNEPLIAE